MATGNVWPLTKLHRREMPGHVTNTTL